MAQILLADDDQATLEMVRRALEADGHRVTATHDGNEAAAAIEAGGAAFDLLVTDVEMPGLDGIALAARAATARPDIRVLLMSGYPEQLARTTGLPAARVGTIGKPFKLDDMKAAVRRLLQ